MKYLVSAFVVVVGIFMGCEDSDPDYPIEPFIELEDLAFHVSPNNLERDSLTVTIKFRDGDGDLGLGWGSMNNPEETSDPYHATDFYIADGIGGLIPVATETIVTNENPPRFFNPVLKSTNLVGTLATIRTKDQPGYEYLPPNVTPDKCLLLFRYQ